MNIMYSGTVHECLIYKSSNKTKHDCNNSSEKASDQKENKKHQGSKKEVYITALICESVKGFPSEQVQGQQNNTMYPISI